jgi:hypothetical protein
MLYGPWPRCFSAARGRSQRLFPRRQGWRSGEGARARSRCPRGTQPGSKRPIDQHSVAAGRGVGAPSHHAVRQPTPAPRPARVCAACPPVRTGPETTVRQHRGLEGLTLDAGAPRHYIPNACKEGGQTAEEQWQECYNR